MILLASVFFIFFFDSHSPKDPNSLSNRLEVPKAAISAGAWGIIGAVLRGVWFLKTKVDDRKYRNSLDVYFASIPFLGGILGSVVYLILLGGLYALRPQGATATQYEINPLTIIPFAALAGYNCEWAINIFNRIGEFLIENKPQSESKTR